MLLNSLYFKLSRVPRKHTLVLIYTNSTFYKQFDKNNYLTYISHILLAITHLFLAKHRAQFTNIVLYVMDITEYVSVQYYIFTGPSILLFI